METGINSFLKLVEAGATETIILIVSGNGTCLLKQAQYFEYFCAIYFPYLCGT